MVIEELNKLIKRKETIKSELSYLNNKKSSLIKERNKITKLLRKEKKTNYCRNCSFCMIGGERIFCDLDKKLNINLDDYCWINFKRR